LGNKIQ